MRQSRRFVCGARATHERMKTILCLFLCAGAALAEPVSDEVFAIIDQRAAWATRFYATASPEKRKEYDRILAEYKKAFHERNVAKARKLALELTLKTGTKIELNENEPKVLEGQLKAMEKFIAERLAAERWERMERAYQLQLQEELINAINRLR